ncbi:MAG: MarR family transcriptional regulator [Clostridiales bacterium]|nr:MarR family transcriptional regulator [Clostridiales bacterium]
MNDMDYFAAGYNIFKAAYILTEKKCDYLESLNLTTNQVSVLIYLSDHEKTRLFDLKQFLNISHQTARNIVVKLRQNGLADVEVSAADGRAKLVYLTEEEKKISDMYKKNLSFTTENMLSCLSEEERQILFSILETLSKNF